MTTKRNIYNIPAGLPFAQTLAAGIAAMTQGGDPLALARMRVLLPTRRGARVLREAFLNLRGGTPSILPRMEPLGDVDEEELSITLSGADTQSQLDLPPAIKPMKRIFLLARLIAARGYGKSMEQDLALAAALARLIDQIHTESLDLADLPGLVDRDKFANHWQISLDFLSLISEHWPKILQENGEMEAAERRNILMKTLSQSWQDTPSNYPVIAAGTTGSIPATAELLKTIAAMKSGYVVLPGLDQSMDDESWHAIDDTHPQATLKNLLAKLDVERQDVQLWPACAKADIARETKQIFISELMRPAATSQSWQTLKHRLDLNADDLNIERYDCASAQEEALTAALAMRHVLEDPTKTVALITPDRKLARRVTTACRRWGIELDDSSGEPLPATRAGTYLRLCMETLAADMRPVSLLDFTKHALCLPPAQETWRSDIRALDREIMRGPAFEGGMESYDKKIISINQDRALRGLAEKDFAAEKKTLSSIANGFAPLIAFSNQTRSALDWNIAHLQVAEYFCPPDILWSGEDGEAASSFFSEFQEAASFLPDMTAQDYLATLVYMMKTATVRPSYGRHPRAFILGQLEARLINADVTILAGLNEGTWPAEPSPDPWMSRPMRKNFGLPPAERSIGLSAHDFVQNIFAGKVILTRAQRVDGTPTVPSRWLQRMDTVLHSLAIDPAKLSNGPYLEIAKALDVPEHDLPPLKRPEPKPPIEARPRKLPVTKIDLWMKDPYGIYAEYILKLRALRPLEQSLDNAIRGTMIHDVLDRFTAKYPKEIPDSAEDDFMMIAREELENMGLDADVRGYWEPRLAKIAGWLVSMERTWRMEMLPAVSESRGEITLYGPQGPFVLHGRADRIDVTKDGRAAAIIDYKSGGTYTDKGIKNGKFPQLPLEALMLEEGTFEGLENRPVEKLSYWVVNGGRDGGKNVTLSGEENVAIAKENARAGLEKLIETFDNPQTPYYNLPRPEYAPPYNDYEHLARVREWAALDDKDAS